MHKETILLEQLQRLLAPAEDDQSVIVELRLRDLEEPVLLMYARDLRPLVAEEIDRVAELASQERRIVALEAELDRTLEDVAFYRDRLQIVENALMPFGDAGKRFWVTGDGSYADALRDVMGNGGVALRRAWDAMKGHGL